MSLVVARARREQGHNAEASSVGELTGYGSPRRARTQRERGLCSPKVILGELGREDFALRGENGTIESAAVDERSHGRNLSKADVEVASSGERLCAT